MEATEISWAHQVGTVCGRYGSSSGVVVRVLVGSSALHMENKVLQAGPTPADRRADQMGEQNGLTLYKKLLRPILNYACHAWGHLADTYMRRMKAFQSMCLKIIVDAPWYVWNETLHRDLDMPTIKNHFRNFAKCDNPSVLGSETTRCDRLRVAKEDCMLVSGLKQGYHQRKVFFKQRDSITSDGMVRNNLDGKDEERISRFNRGGYDKYVDDTSYDQRTESYNNYFEHNNKTFREGLGKDDLRNADSNKNLRGTLQSNSEREERQIISRRGIDRDEYIEESNISYRGKLDPEYPGNSEEDSHITYRRNFDRLNYNEHSASDNKSGLDKTYNVEDNKNRNGLSQDDFDDEESNIQYRKSLNKDDYGGKEFNKKYRNGLNKEGYDSEESNINYRSGLNNENYYNEEGNIKFTGGLNRDNYDGEERNLNYRSGLNKDDYDSQESGINFRSDLNKDDYDIEEINLKYRGGLNKDNYDSEESNKKYRSGLNKDDYDSEERNIKYGRGLNEDGYDSEVSKINHRIGLNEDDYDSEEININRRCGLNEDYYDNKERNINRRSGLNEDDYDNQERNINRRSGLNEDDYYSEERNINHRRGLNEDDYDSQERNINRRTGLNEDDYDSEEININHRRGLNEDDYDSQERNINHRSGLNEDGYDSEAINITPRIGLNKYVYDSEETNINHRNGLIEDGYDSEEININQRGGLNGDDYYSEERNINHRSGLNGKDYDSEERNINHRSGLNEDYYDSEERNINHRSGLNGEDYDIENRNIKQRNGLIKGYHNHNRETINRKDLNRGNYHNIHKINSKTQMRVNSYDDDLDLDDNDMWNIENKDFKNTQIGNITLWDGDKDVNTNYENSTDRYNESSIKFRVGSDGDILELRSDNNLSKIGSLENDTYHNLDLEECCSSKRDKRSLGSNLAKKGIDNGETTHEFSLRECCPQKATKSLNGSSSRSAEGYSDKKHNLGLEDCCDPVLARIPEEGINYGNKSTFKHKMETKIVSKEEPTYRQNLEDEAIIKLATSSDSVLAEPGEDSQNGQWNEMEDATSFKERNYYMCECAHT
uniref:Uncharacterized protein n=1 Tax=Timema bartmani TaxID=61472 RepID=A0A7R9F562_9NEOP|nr:unnamed protein product [Timema bartmani]